MAHAVDLLVDGRFLLDVGVGARHVRFGLVVVVVGDEILDGVVGEEALHLAIELGREGFVGGEDQRRALRAHDGLRGGEGLARAGDAEQDLVGLAVLDALDDVGDGGGLVAGGLIGRHQLERDSTFGLFARRGAVRHPGGVAFDLLAAVEDDVLEGLDGRRDADGLRALEVLAGEVDAAAPRLARLVLRDGAARLLRMRLGNTGGWDVAEAGLFGFAEAVEIGRADDGVGLRFRGLQRHAGGGGAGVLLGLRRLWRPPS